MITMHVTPSFVESVLSAYPFALLIIRDEHLTDESELKKTLISVIFLKISFSAAFDILSNPFHGMINKSLC